MNQKKISSRLYQIAKSIAMAAMLPVFLIYVMIDKPDYKIMNGLAHVVLPAAEFIGDGISWPLRAAGKAATSLREFSNLRTENEELKARLADALANKNECDVAISENQRLMNVMDISRATPQKTIAAAITYDNKAFNHNTFFINKGVKSGVETGMAVVSFDKMLIGVVSDVGVNFAKVRSLRDTQSNIPVRIAGSEVYGFLHGNGSDTPEIGFFSDPEFQPAKGLKLITSGIRGILPDGIAVGELISATEAGIPHPTSKSDCLVLEFDGKERYK
ncbi:MAG: rod shape-determining protein MreC [Rickettsiales bacterium]|jgi:rod shape-determining protein MreC|nr:rod shape-determining protein MreC [Rickettsiales bacterium]